MTNITDSTYFENGNLYIPNNIDINVNEDGSPSNKTGLDFIIDEYERDLLINALGVDLYEELQVALLDLPNAGQKWIDLVDGVVYTNPHGNRKSWEGLKGINSQNSVIACYVFCEYLRDYNETFATTGVVKNVSKNAENVNPTPKFIKAYNKFLVKYQSEIIGTEPILIVNKSGHTGLDYFSGQKTEVSLFTYLSDQNEIDETSFPDFEESFRVYDIINTYGI